MFSPKVDESSLKGREKRTQEMEAPKEEREGNRILKTRVQVRT
jgi:hypothetical protein